MSLVPLDSIPSSQIMAAAKPRTLNAVLMLSEKARKLFDPRSRTVLVQSTLRDAGLDWVDAYLHFRFDPAYARQFLGYVVTKGTTWRKKRWGVTEPLVWTGRMRRSIYENHRVDVTGSKNPVLRIRLGRVWPKVVHRVLTTMPAREVTFVAGAWRRRMATALNSAMPSSFYQNGPRKGQPKRLTLSGAASPVVPENISDRNDQHFIKRRRERVNLARASERELAETREDRKHRVINARQHVWNRWRRQAGGSAPGGAAGEGLSQSYSAGPRFLNAERQRRWRARQRASRTPPAA